jgi:ABC-2 type transport system permease protein
MRTYYYFFKIRFHVGVQYRAAAFMGLITQFVWGLMECIVFKILLEANAASSPMSIAQVVSYFWLNQAFLMLFNTWAADNDIFSMILDGGIAYELCRPVSIYSMWFSRTVGGRVAEAGMRCIPIIIAAFLLPEPYQLMFPKNIGVLLLFIFTLILALCVTVSFCMLVYIISFFTISPQGIRMVLTGAVELLSGAIIPLPFIPDPFRRVLELLPFASMQNVPLRIYCGNLTGSKMIEAITLQLFWLIILVLLGKALCKLAERRIVVQGG